MRKLVVLVFASFLSVTGFSQNFNLDSSLKVIQQKKDSTIMAQKKIRDSIYQSSTKADSIKTEKQFKNKFSWEKLKAVAIFPVMNLGENSGVIPVKDPTEIPDLKLQYKLLFELTVNNPDSVIKEINYGLVEAARVINLHVASGIPLKNIVPVIVIHGGALNALTTNEYFQKKYKMENPNIKAIAELEKVGTRFIACGQAMNFQGMAKENFLPMLNISLTAKTVITSYQLRGFVLLDVN
jgi:intracellular sulfur oxidation DsrE/DsrF family protein